MSLGALVVGAGPAGLAAAARLADWCAAVTVVEARPRGRLRHAGEHLPPAGLAALGELGLGGLLDDPRHGDSPGVRSVWGDGRAAERDYFFSLPSWGLNLHRPVFDEALARHAEAGGAALMFATRLRELEREGRGFRATLAWPGGARTLAADVVVDASGRRAAAARLLGATRRRHDRQVGIAGTLEDAPPGEDPGRLMIEAAPDGWWYGVRLPAGQWLATFMTDAAVVCRHPGGPRGLWRERLGASRLLGPVAAEARRAGRVEAFDASVQLLEPTAEAGFLAVGDAAAAFDPLSSWGIAKGISDGHAGAGALERAWGGEAGALDRHRRGQRRAFERHAARRRDVYLSEGRWPASPFWQARRGAPAPLAQATG